MNSLASAGARRQLSGADVQYKQREVVNLNDTTGNIQHKQRCTGDGYNACRDAGRRSVVQQRIDSTDHAEIGEAKSERR